MVRHLLAGACLVSALLGCTAAPAAPLRQVATPTVAPAPAPAPASGEVASPAVAQYHATELRPGDCIEPMPDSFIVTVVGCSVPHAAEFATTYVIPDGPWPGFAEMEKLAVAGCGPRMRYVASRMGEVGAAVLVPAEADWPRFRTAYCLAAPFDGGKLVGRVIK
ncbi:hypothetical protein [Nonomuraea sp. NEAU-A123]|uniref:hypothetical protein n=1 Tax=Nonomuraea sp. NEAU-A123 TaxID=2839649 RepID=UPI001BE4155D|nr:hypothetical protein [Nonomuraea sp. NEAU-A123]MBT2231496.1 hypothetical protein [Nonomuraea sp. NEAU-A123]